MYGAVLQDRLLDSEVRMSFKTVYLTQRFFKTVYLTQRFFKTVYLTQRAEYQAVRHGRSCCHRCYLTASPTSSPNPPPHASLYEEASLASARIVMDGDGAPSALYRAEYQAIRHGRSCRWRCDLTASLTSSPNPPPYASLYEEASLASAKIVMDGDGALSALYRAEYQAVRHGRSCRWRCDLTASLTSSPNPPPHASLYEEASLASARIMMDGDGAPSALYRAEYQAIRHGRSCRWRCDLTASLTSSPDPPPHTSLYEEASLASAKIVMDRDGAPSALYRAEYQAVRHGRSCCHRCYLTASPTSSPNPPPHASLYEEASLASARIVMDGDGAPSALYRAEYQAVRHGRSCCHRCYLTASPTSSPNPPPHASLYEEASLASARIVMDGDGAPSALYRAEYQAIRHGRSCRWRRDLTASLTSSPNPPPHASLYEDASLASARIVMDGGGAPSALYRAEYQALRHGRS
ncbi:hypothetical protein BDR07DRAFT_1384562 [Suillus spraguei]|nr:hypothetical protein BDR07DRAFT_1384562 [Suillus spraguei]